MGKKSDLDFEQILPPALPIIDWKLEDENYVWRDENGTVLVKLWCDKDFMWTPIYDDKVAPKPYLYWRYSNLDSAIAKATADVMPALIRRLRKKARRR
jgi:hypothetical protein